MKVVVKNIEAHNELRHTAIHNVILLITASLDQLIGYVHTLKVNVKDGHFVTFKVVVKVKGKKSVVEQDYEWVEKGPNPLSSSNETIAQEIRAVIMETIQIRGRYLERAGGELLEEVSNLVATRN